MNFERPLTLKEFLTRDENNKPSHGNFFMYFVDGGLANLTYRITSHFIRFQTEHSELEDELTSAISAILNKVIRDSRHLEPHEPKMYEAYLIMQGYGVKNRELFA